MQFGTFFFFLPAIHIQTEQAQSAHLRQWEHSVSQDMYAYIICEPVLYLLSLVTVASLIIPADLTKQ